MKENFTRTPNILFDQLLKELSFSELKILMVIIRQTNGWIDKKTKKRKERDRITHSQFISKTGLSRRVISETIKSLLERRLIHITDKCGNALNNPKDRTGQSFIYYSETCAENDNNLCTFLHQPVQNMVHNKRNYNKRNYNKRNLSKERQLDYKHIGEIIEKKKLKWKPKIKE